MNAQPTVLAGSQRWKEGCLEMAYTGKPFAIEGLDARQNQNFCNMICTVFHYEIDLTGGRILFKPLRAYPSN